VVAPGFFHLQGYARESGGDEGGRVELVELGHVELTYTALESLDFGPDGQLYGTMEGRLSGDRLQGALRLTNLAPRRADNVNLPTLRGLLTTDDGATVWIELEALRRSAPPTRRGSS
jgi:hypothetical protein